MQSIRMRREVMDEASRMGCCRNITVDMIITVHNAVSSKNMLESLWTESVSKSDESKKSDGMDCGSHFKGVLGEF